jgi:WD40 repeat protein
MATSAGLRIDREKPWPGLFPYSEDASAFLNGREPETAELLRLVRRDGLCLLYGQSGLGKSSLIQAGLFPRLREEAFLPVYVRLDFTSAIPLREQLWRVFRGALDRHGIDARRPDEGEGLWVYFNDARLELWDAANRALAPVIVLDQFEEIFTSGAPLAAHLGVNPVPVGGHPLDGFLAELAELIDARVPARVRAELESDASAPSRYHFGAPRFRVVLGFREDFLPEFEELFRALRLPTGARLRLTRMRHTQALDAVRRTGGELVDAEVALEIVNFVSGRSRAGQTAEIEPALLSVVCYELNSRRRQRAEARISSALLSGARDQIIDEFYHRSLAHAPAALREFIEEELLTESGYRDSSAIEDAVKRPGVTESAIRDLVEKRVLRLEERFGVLRVELTHDLLTAVVLKDRNERFERQRLDAEREREAARLRRTRRLLRLGMATAAGAAILVIVFAVLLQRAEDEKARVIQAQSSLLLARATAALESNVPKEPYVSLVRAMALDPGNTGAAARSISLLTQRSYANLELAVPWDGASPNAFVAAIDANTVVLRRGGLHWVLTSGPKPALACLRAGLESRDQDVRAALSWPAGREIGAEQVKALAQAASLACEVAQAKRAALHATLLGVSSGAAAYLTRAGELLVVPLDGSARRAAKLGDAMKDPRRVWLDRARTHAVVANVNDALLVALEGSAAPRAIPVDPAQGAAEVVRAWFSPAADSLLVSRRSGRAELFRTSTLERVRAAPLELGEAAAFSPSGKWLAWLCEGRADFVDAESGAVGGMFKAQGPGFNHVAFDALAREGRVMASGDRAVLSSQSGQAYVVSVPEARVELTLPHQGSVVEAHFIDARNVVTASFDGSVRVFSAQTGAPVLEPMLHRGALSFARPLAAATAPAVRVVSLADDQQMRVWTAPLGAPPAYREPIEPSFALDFSRDGRHFARIDSSGLVHVGDVDPGLGGETREATAALSIPGTHARRVRLRDDGAMVAWVTDDARLAWRSTGAAEVFAVPEVRLPAAAMQLEFAREAPKVAARLEDRTIRIVDLAQRRLAGLPIALDEGTVAWGFAANGRDVLVASTNRLEAYDAATGFRTASAPAPGVVSADVNAARAEVAYSLGRTLALWSAAAPKDRKSRGLNTFVTVVRYSPDGSKIVTASVDGNVEVLDAATLEPLGAPLRHNISVAQAELSFDGRWAMTRTLDGVVRIWDYSTGQVVVDPIAVSAKAGRALLVGDDNWLAVLGDDGDVSWRPVAIGFPRPLPDWFAEIFGSLSGLAGVDEMPGAAKARGNPAASPEWQAWWSAWRRYVTSRQSAQGGL